MSQVIKDVLQHKGHEIPIEWHDADSFEDVPKDQMVQIYAVAFYAGEEVILVEYESDRDNLPGGTIEQGEDYESALHREMKEETNTRVVNWLPIGYQKAEEPDGSISYSLRVAAKVEPEGEFVSDPDGTVIGNLYVAPELVNDHIQYGEIGERMMGRALEVKSEL